MTNKKLLKMAIEIVGFPMKNMVIFKFLIAMLNYQRVKRKAATSLEHFDFVPIVAGKSTLGLDSQERLQTFHSRFHLRKQVA